MEAYTSSELAVAEQLSFKLGIDAGSVAADAKEAGAAAGAAYKKAFDKAVEGGEKVEQQMELKLSTVGYDQVKSNLKSLENKMVPIRAHMKKLKKQNSVWSKMSRGAQRASASVKKLVKNIRKLTNRGKGVSAIGDALKGVTGKFALANVAASAVVAGFAAIGDAIGSVAQRAKDIAGVRKALAGFVSDQGQIETIMDSTRATSMKYGVSVQSLEKAWARLGPAAQATGMNLAETNAVITAATARMARMGLNSEQAGRYMETLAQVMGKGKLQGEELNQQFAELDGALRAQLASYFKTTKGIDDLSGAIQKGQIKAGDFAKALVSISKGDMASLAIDLKNLQSEIDNLDPNQVQSVFNNLMDFAGQDMAAFFGPFIKEISKAGVAVAGFMAAFKNNYPEVWSMSQTVFTGLGQFISFVTKGLVLLAHVVGDFANSFVKMVGDFVASAKKIPVLGEVLGIVENASAAFGAALDHMGKEADKAVDSVLQIDKVAKTNSVEKLTGDVDDFGTEADDAADKAERLKQKINGYKKLKEKNEDFFTKESRRIKDVIKDLDTLKKNENRRYDDAIRDTKRAGDEEQKRFQKAIDNVNREKEAAADVYDDRIDKVKELSDAEARKTDKAISAINREKEAASRRYDMEIAKIEKAAARAAQYYADRIKAIEREKDAVQRAADARMEKLDRAEKRAQARADAEVQAVQSQMQAEQERLDKELEGINAAHEASMAAMTAERDKYIADMKQKREAVEGQAQAELLTIEKTRNAAERKHAAALNSIQQQRDAISALEAQQIGALEALTPAEERLAEIRRQKLEATARDVNLSEEERLTARAALDDMDRQAAIQEVQRQAKEEQARLDKEQLSREEKHKLFIEELAVAEKTRTDQMNQQLAAIDQQIAKAGEVYDAESQAAQAMLDQKIAFAQQAADAAIQGLELELEKAEQVADAIDGRFDRRRDKIEATTKKKIESLDKEQERLQDLADWEQRSADKKIEKIEEERTASEAAAEEKISQLEDELKKKQEVTEATIKGLEDEKEASQETYENMIDALEERKTLAQDATEAALQGLKDEKEAFNRNIDDMKQAEKDRYDALKRLHNDTSKRLDRLIDLEKDLANGANDAAKGIGNQAGAVNNLATAYNNLAISLNNVATAQRNAGPAGGSPTAVPTRFAGGPMKGGSRSHVNELGQEAFLTASGKLSLINAKPWEVWKAPSDGTVIPAHLTSQLDIPRGGINLNQKAPTAAKQAPSSSRGLERALRTIQGAMAGNTTNNVTIQAANTTQAASDMLVSLNRIKRRRNT